MKKILGSIVIGLILQSFATFAFADPASCAYLTYGGKGGVFIAPDNSMDAKLYYDSDTGNGISGGFGAILDGHHYAASLVDSHCQDGIVKLQWSTRNFAGRLVGQVTKTGLVNVYGYINEQLVTNAILVYQGAP
jgi:hypothetical protein